jgi:hypothetical protein
VESVEAALYEYERTPQLRAHVANAFDQIAPVNFPRLTAQQRDEKLEAKSSHHMLTKGGDLPRRRRRRSRPFGAGAGPRSQTTSP